MNILFFEASLLCDTGFDRIRRAEASAIGNWSNMKDLGECRDA